MAKSLEHVLRVIHFVFSDSSYIKLLNCVYKEVSRTNGSNVPSLEKDNRTLHYIAEKQLKKGVIENGRKI